MYAQLLNPDSALPWEDGRITDDDKRKLGVFGKAVLRLLQRDPHKRATARSFCTEMFNLFSKDSKASVSHESVIVCG